ncbi:pectate lyase family protein [Paenibacillus pasadenensis]|uniref:pectate lyase family protein n=1 Tax=Paenibacillus TaxID=44249 RepID=UPI0004255ADB|nr:pectate lyase [Paenibacillus pasadenensis]
MKKRIIRLACVALAAALLLTILSGGRAATIHAAGLAITSAGGWNETAYVEWTPESGATGYQVYVKPAGAADAQYRQLDNELIRRYPSYWRADAVGLAAGSYVLKVEALLSGGGRTSVVTGALPVAAHDRSGFAFAPGSAYGTGSGAYNEDGTLRAGAKVLYVTSATARTVELDVVTSSSGAVQKGIGIAQIMELRQKGYDKTPLAVRIVGQITEGDMSGQLNGSGYLQVKGKADYAELNLTIEGIGKDASAYGWGLLLRSVGNVEVRNIGWMLFPDDGISLDTGNANVWVHHNDLFYGKAGSDADQAKGDGSTDLKKGSTHITISYNHYWDSGKASLVGLSETAEFFATFHHNWFDHSDSRHPRIRVASVHIYNNFFDGISKYGVGVTTGASAFVEANYFRHAKHPMLSSLQGTDALGEGTFSGENGGMIKAYGNIVVDAESLIYANSDAGTAPAHASSFDAYLASARSEAVPAAYKALKGGTPYNNFDTRIATGADASDVDPAGQVEAIVTAEAGRLGGGDFAWTFNDAADDTSYAVLAPLMAKIVSYRTQLVSVGGNASPATPTPSPTASPTAAPTATPTATPTPTSGPTATPGAGVRVHNFTADGLTSSFFAIQGSLSSTKGTVIYDGLTLTSCLKMESSTSISFTAATASTLTLVFNSPDGTKVNIDGAAHAMTNGTVSVALSAGAHSISKNAVANLYYMKLVPSS